MIADDGEPRHTQLVERRSNERILFGCPVFCVVTGKEGKTEIRSEPDVQLIDDLQQICEILLCGGGQVKIADLYPRDNARRVEW